MPAAVHQVETKLVSGQSKAPRSPAQLSPTSQASSFPTSHSFHNWLNLGFPDLAIFRGGWTSVGS